MLAVLSEVLPVPARDEPLDLAAQVASSSSSSSSGGGGGKRKRAGKKIGTLEELLEKHPEEFKEIFIDGTEQEFCQSPRTKLAAKGTTAANERGTPQRCRW
jgi:hypothetical protein